MNDDQITVRGQIKALFYEGPRFSAGLLINPSGEAIKFAGKMFVRLHDQVVFHGRWVKHPKYGHQLQVDSMEYDLELSKDGLANYLAHHPDFKGVGPIRAQLIADHFGHDFDKAIVEQPQAIAKIAKIPLLTAEKIRDAWQDTKAMNQAITWLAHFGLTHHQVTALVKKFGNGALGLLKADPYLIIQEVHGFGFKQVDKIARKMGTSKNDPARIRAGVLHSVSEMLDQGHCWTEFNDLIEQANTLLMIDEEDSRDHIEKGLNDLINDGFLTCPSHEGMFLVAKPEILQAEQYLANILQQGEKPNSHFDPNTDLDSMVSFIAPDLNENQKKAILTVLTHSITLITGGAGSGKSYTVSALADICEEADLHVVLAAPTGKAAKRLEEISGRSASTIHRLLGFNGKGYGFGEGPVDLAEANVLIVDEVSMVDVTLAWRLFQAVDLDQTIVVLVGDHNQLPPVGPGNMLRDLVQTKILPTVVLDTVIRQAGVLKENSTTVLQGEVRKTSEIEESERRAWYVIDQFSDPSDIQRFLLELYEDILSERLHFNLVRDVQVLTPTHKGNLGTRELNIALQKLIQHKVFGITVQPVPPGKKPRLYVHDKVIQTRNNYDIGVMNGTVGFVTQVESNGAVSINFEGSRRRFKAGSPNLNDIQLAYALTIHKVQGSEFRCAIVITHKSHSFMHHRNLLYTGVTRAKETAIILGDRWGIQNCAHQRHLNNRNTFLSLFLSEQVMARSA